jgi:hypothetical protein
MENVGVVRGTRMYCGASSFQLVSPSHRQFLITLKPFNSTETEAEHKLEVVVAYFEFKGGKSFEASRAR